MRKSEVIEKKKPGPGRKPYTHEDQFTVAIQFYRKAGQIKKLGGIKKVRAFSEAEFDRRLKLLG